MQYSVGGRPSKRGVDLELKAIVYRGHFENVCQIKQFRVFIDIEVTTNLFFLYILKYPHRMKTVIFKNQISRS